MEKQLELSLSRKSRDRDVRLPAVVRQETVRWMATLMAQVVVEDETAPLKAKEGGDE